MLAPSSTMPATITMRNEKPAAAEAAPEEEQDIVSQAVGDYGPWQLRLTFLLAMFNLPCTWHIMAITFQGRDMPFWCARPDALRDNDVPPEVWRNISHPEGGDNCAVWDVDYSTHTMLEDMGRGAWLDLAVISDNVTRACTSWEFDTSDGKTINSEWQLVCDRKLLSNVAEMMFLVGVALGGLISGIISDNLIIVRSNLLRFGRKTTLMGALTLQVLSGTGIAFAPWFELYMTLRIILGFVSVSIVFSAFVLCMEMVGGKWRTISGVSFLFPVPLGYISVSGIAYLVREWQYLQLAITLPAILLFSLFWVLPESPRWLLAMGRQEELLKVLQKGAICNKRPAPVAKQLQVAARPGEEADGRGSGFFDLFRTAHIRRISLLLYVIWFTLYLVYYGLMLNLGNMAGDLYLNVVVAGLVELPAIALSIMLLLRSGRRVPLCLTIAGSGVACLLTLVVPQDPTWPTLVLAMVGKFAISCSNAILPVFTAELFPTVMRNLGVGSSNMSAGIALMLVPYLWNLSSVWSRLPMAVLGGMGVLGGLETAAELREKTMSRQIDRTTITGSYRRTMSPERY
ncbi:hypothetical protein B566_EDAN007083 [Ephemera danica]|nr:hypothetical protein B566_EDAN007083 [Ephemera danica]